MMKIAIPVLLSGIIIIAGIFAFIPIDMATTVHSTLQGTQLNNVLSTFDSDLSSNATASCAGGDFLVHYVFSNSSTGFTQNGGITQLGIDDPTNGAISADIVITLTVGNQTSVGGTVGGTAGETITFFGNSTGRGVAANTASTFEDVGDLALTVVCQSGQAPSLTP